MDVPPLNDHKSVRPWKTSHSTISPCFISTETLENQGLVCKGWEVPDLGLSSHAVILKLSGLEKGLWLLPVEWGWIGCWGTRKGWLESRKNDCWPVVDCHGQRRCWNCHYTWCPLHRHWDSIWFNPCWCRLLRQENCCTCSRDDNVSEYATTMNIVVHDLSTWWWVPPIHPNWYISDVWIDAIITAVEWVP